MFLTHLSWSAAGFASRSALIANLKVVKPESFLLALDGLIRSWSVLKYSQQNPDTSMYRDYGFGELKWQDGNGQRTRNVQFYFAPSGWVAGQQVTLTMQAVA